MRDFSYINKMIAELAPPNTKLKWSNARANFGMCSYPRENPTYFIITISKPLAELNDDETVKQVVLHEIAHALTPGHGHDTTWKQKCLELGGNGERCYNQLAVKTPKHNWMIRCPMCGFQEFRFKQPKDNTLCPKCRKSAIIRDLRD